MAVAGASGEDAASVLETFIHDSANLPAEIQHLLEEVQAKDTQLSEHRAIINNRDLSLQKFVKNNGFGSVKHPKEDIWMKAVSEAFDRAQALQEEKVGLANRAAFLLDRHVKRLDHKIQDLQNEGAIPPDATLPTLLHDSEGNIVPPAGTSATNTGVNTPLSHQLTAHHNPTGAAPVNAAAMARMLHHANTAQPAAPVAGMQPQPHPLSQVQQHHGGQQRHQRETSTGASSDTTKRRRLNQSASGQSLQLPSSGLARHHSAGPTSGGGGGTPKAGTPTAGTSRAGSAGPGRTMTKKPSTSKRIAPHQASSLRKQLNKSGQKSIKRMLQGKKGTPTSTGDEDDENNSGEDEGDVVALTKEGAADDGDEGGYDEEGDDNRLYCVCQKPSHGSMVACDNDNCRREWFHWSCVGLTDEPEGRWLCPECRKLPEKQLKYAR